MSEIVRITFEYNDKVMVCEGEEAEYLSKSVEGMCYFMHNRGMNPFERRPVKWTTTKLTNTADQTVQLAERIIAVFFNDNNVMLPKISKLEIVDIICKFL